jgi:hypothetical protein
MSGILDRLDKSARLLSAPTLPVPHQHVFIVKQHGRPETFGYGSETPDRQVDTAEVDLLRQVNTRAGSDDEADIGGFQLEESEDLGNDHGSDVIGRSKGELAAGGGRIEPSRGHG